MQNKEFVVQNKDEREFSAGPDSVPRRQMQVKHVVSKANTRSLGSKMGPFFVTRVSLFSCLTGTILSPESA